MVYFAKSVWACLCMFVVFSLLGCAMDEYHIKREWYSWHYEGLADDTTAVVSVTHGESGDIECHHLMSYEDGESFTRTISKKYYKVGMKSLWVGEQNEDLLDLLPEKRKMNDIYPRWSDGCLDMDSLNGKFYCVEADFLDNYTYSCGLILIDGSNMDLDTLEIPSCKSNLYESVSFVSNYLKVNEFLFTIANGKFISQEPTYKLVEENGDLKFLDKSGDFVIYSGKPL